MDMQGDEIIAGSPSVSSASVFAPGYGNPSNVASYLRKRLYLADAAASPPADPGKIAFLYKYKLYGPVSNQTEVIQRQFEHLSAYYGDAQRRQIQDALVELRKGLARNPESDILGHLLLDIYYDHTVAETVYARELLQKAELARFGGGELTLAAPPPPGKFIIENEIAAYQLALSSNSVVLANCMGLLRDPVECRLFQRLAPERGLAPATYLKTNEQGVAYETLVAEGGSLYDRFKDLALVYELLGDHGQAAAALARLHMAKGDTQAAQNIVSRTKRLLTLHNALLLGLFDLQLSADDPSRVTQAIARMNNSLADLELLRQTQRGRVNLLGFADDFLMFVQPKNPDGAASASTFDTLQTFLNPTLPGMNPLSFALSELEVLEKNYKRYRDSQDDLAEQFSDSSITYSDRLRDIVGVFPTDPTYSDVPTAHEGSELDQQFTSIELARNRIFENSTRIENLRMQVDIELNKAASISNVMVDFGNQRAFATEVIGHISAAQAGLNAGANAFSDPIKLTTGLFVYDLVNAEAQSLGEEGKAQLEAEKERLSALEQATIVNIETDALVKTLLLDMNVLLVDSQEAALTLRQEIHRLQGLLREKKQLEDRLALRDLRLARRYFADPVHRLSAQSYVIRANQAFESAQRWLFYLVRALEYKWNEDFGNYPYSNRYWSSQSIFGLRNALELNDYFMAMMEYDAPKDNTTSWQSPGWDYFSLRDDHFSCGSIGEFRELLHQAVDTNSTQKLIVLHFNTASTVRNLFLGATFDASGHLDEDRKGSYLDRIMEMRILIAGRDSLRKNEVPQVSLTYGGTSLIRNRVVGKYDTTRADRLRDEFTLYSTRFYQSDGSNYDDWISVEALSAQGVSAKLGESTGTKPDVTSIIQFAERSVAATDWTLKIPTQDSIARPYFIIDDVEDIEIWFYHRGADRTK
ncbi:MAG TPA: hypothetical protein P5525_07130 [Candidatus Paceibacterota bacterium]|nr:hypothetical protein [Candidatus Paceibacterota bacterium]